MAPAWFYTFAEFYGCFNICIVVVGLIGHILTLSTLKFDKKSKLSTRLLMAALVVTDSFSLIRSLSGFTSKYYRFSLQNISPLTVKLYYFGLQASNEGSKLILLILALERFYVVYRPMKASFQNLTKPSMLGLLAAVFVAVGKNAIILWRGYEVVNGKRQITYPYNAKLFEYASYLVSTIYILLIIVVNVSILLIITKTQKKMKAFQDGGNEAQQSAVYRKSIAATKMVFGNSVFVFLFQTPIAIFMIVHLSGNLRHMSATASGKLERTTIALALTQLRELKYALNFYIYVLVSTNFRKVVINMFRSKVKQ